MKNLIYKPGIGTLTFALGLMAVWFSLFEREQEAEKTPQAVVSENKVELTKEGIESPKEIDFENLPQNPYQLQKIINENRDYFPADKLWEKFSIEARMSLLDNPFFTEDREPEFFYNCSSCNAEIFEINLDNDTKKEVLLGIGEQGGYGNYRFLAFKESKNNWKFIGHADHDINKYYSPEVRVENFNSKIFLVLTCLGGWGTGISISFERWYELRNNQLIEVLSFPNKSYSSMTTVDLRNESKVRVKNHSSKQGEQYFEIEFINNFSGYSESCNSHSKNEEWKNDLLFRSKKIGYYVKDKNGVYRLNEKTSNITTDEIEKAYIPFGLDQKNFKRLYPNEINAILRERKSCRAKWLKQWFSWER